LITEADSRFLKSAILSAQQILELGEKEAGAAEWPAALEKVTQLLLRTVGKTSRTQAALVISPMVRLGGPWSALSLTKDRYVIEDHVVSYRISGRKLVPTSTEKNGRADASAVILPNQTSTLSHVSTSPQFLGMTICCQPEVPRLPAGSRNWTRRLGRPKNRRLHCPN